MRTHLLFAATLALCAFLGRKAVTHVDDLLRVIFIIAACQFALAVYFWAKLRSQRAAHAAPRGDPPSVGLVVCVKGAGPELGRCVRSILDQDYTGKVERVFVVPSEEDPGFAALQELLPAGDPGTRLLASEMTSRRASAKNTDMLYALRRLESGPELLLFADADAEFPRGWLRSLAAALDDPGVGCATTWHIQGPVRGPGDALRLAGTASTLPLLFLSPRVWGGSMAVRSGDFRAFGLEESWSRAVNEEGPVQDAVLRSGKRVALVAEALGVSLDSCTLRQFAAQFVRWMQLARLHWPTEWVATGMMLCCKCGVGLWTVWPRFIPRLFWWAVGLDVAYWVVLFVIVAARYGDRLRPFIARAWLPLLGALLGPVFLAVSLLNFIISIPLRTIRWGGRVYRVNGPLDVEVVS